MSLVRGTKQRSDIATVLDVFGADAENFVFLGGCALALYARPRGAPLRTTTDVDCLSMLSPWVLQERILADLCQRQVLHPDHEVQCRYRLVGTNIDVDVLSPEGMNIGGASPWLRRAAEHARTYNLDDGRQVKAVAPAYFLATKLVAFEDRFDPQSSKDLEDIVALAVEVPDLVEEVVTAGLAEDISDLWATALRKHALSSADLDDILDWHLHRDDHEHRGRVLQTLRALAYKS